MAKRKRPEWLTVDLLNRLIDRAETNSSREDYLTVAESCYRWYRGDSSIVPLPGFDDMEIDERQAVARINKIKETAD